MTEQFDPKLVEQAVEAGGRAYAEGGGVEDVALAAVYAVAPTLRAEGAAEAGLITSQRATGAVVSERQRCICGDICLDHCRACNYSGRDLEEPCIADPDWEPDEDDLVRRVEADERRAYQRGMVEGAREVFVAVDWPRNCDKHERVCPYPCAIDAAREAVARIEKGGA